MTAVLVILGAMIGAPLRYLVDRAVQSRHATMFPWGTITVNLIACAGLGLLTGAASAGVTSHQLHALLATGLCATLSTYSTFSYETLKLAEQRRPLYAAANIVISVIAGLGAAALGNAAALTFWT
jgi:fluoride exporter